MMASEGKVDYLAEERAKAEFDVDAMTYLLYGSKERALRVRHLAQIVANDPVFRKDDRLYLSRPAAMKRALEKAKHMYVRSQELGLDREDAAVMRYNVDEISYMDLHWFMFIPAIEGQATEEQQHAWLPRARACAWLGCYAQTELGHGSNVQGLETTATFAPDSDEFEIHSPTLTSTKWWPGGLGKVSTHAIVYARLITLGRDLGIHAFLVQLRSLDDHQPLPGVTVADIGTKFGNGGYNTMDNGLLRFDKCRIPRFNLLAKYGRVTREGKYERPSDAPRQVAYGAMVSVRTSIVREASYYLSRAVTIATRYSAVRRQFGGAPGEPETKVIDYTTQQHRLFVLLATAYAFRFAGQWMSDLFDELMRQLRAGDFTMLPEAHAATAGLKALTTGVTADGIEECRKLCGGHGYLCASGLPELYAAYVPACTYEGDNTVLLLQVARYLVKVVARVAAGRGDHRPGGTAEYLGDLASLASAKCRAQRGEDFLDPGLQLEALSVRAAHLAVACATQLAGDSPEQAFAEHAVDLARAAKAHCQQIVLSKFVEATQGTDASASAGRGVVAQLRTLCHLYALSLLEANTGDFLECGYLSAGQVGLVREQVRCQLAKLRPNAVALVDAFDFTDHLLGSALGRYDGDVYTHLYKQARRDPLNKSAVIDGYEEHIRPLITQQVRPAVGSARL